MYDEWVDFGVHRRCRSRVDRLFFLETLSAFCVARWEGGAGWWVTDVDQRMTGGTTGHAWDGAQQREQKKQSVNALYETTILAPSGKKEREQESAWKRRVHVARKKRKRSVKWSKWLKPTIWRTYDDWSLNCLVSSNLSLPARHCLLILCIFLSFISIRVVYILSGHACSSYYEHNEIWEQTFYVLYVYAPLKVKSINWSIGHTHNWRIHNHFLVDTWRKACFVPFVTIRSIQLVAYVLSVRHVTIAHTTSGLWQLIDPHINGWAIDSHRQTYIYDISLMICMIYWLLTRVGAK